MLNLIIWTVLLAVNAYFSIQDLRKKTPTNWRVMVSVLAVYISAGGFYHALKDVIL
jgi:Flp pilus assembly protein protease CpaA